MSLITIIRPMAYAGPSSISVLAPRRQYVNVSIPKNQGPSYRSRAIPASVFLTTGMRLLQPMCL